ncbi:hypothetical protein VTG60DRAFT_3106 [Thermothelomyces hinnuleus]
MARPEGKATTLGSIEHPSVTVSGLPADQPRGSLFPEWKDSLAQRFQQPKSILFGPSKDSSASLFGQPKSTLSAESTGPSASIFSHPKNTLFGPGASAPLFGQPKSPAEGTVSIVIQPAGRPAKELRISVATSEPPASQDSSLRTQVRVIVGWGSRATVEVDLPPHSPRS